MGRLENGERFGKNHLRRIAEACWSSRQVFSTPEPEGSGAAVAFYAPGPLPSGPGAYAAPDGSGTWALFDGRMDAPVQAVGSEAARLVLDLYQRYGHDLPNYLYGDYVAVVWDAPAGRLLGARDPAQARALYWAVTANGMLFASDPRLILAAGGLPEDYDLAYLTTYAVLSNTNSERTPYGAVKHLQGGWRLLTDAWSGRVETERWWSLPEPGSLRYRCAGDYQAHLRDLVNEAVRARLHTKEGAPVCVALSRGIDSAAVAATAHRLVREGKASCTEVRAVTMSLADYPEGDESRDAARIAAHLGLPHAIVPALPHPGDLAPLLAPLPEPSGLPDRYNLWAPIRDACADSGARVLLTGAGGEHFTSPPYYLADLWRQRRFGLLLGDVPRWQRSSSLLLALRTLLRGLQMPSFDWSPAKRLADYPWLRHPELCEADRESQHLFAHPVLRESHYHAVEAGQVTSALQPLFTQAGIELRNPLLDRRIIEFAYALPWELKLRVPHPNGGGNPMNKPLLRRAFADEVPLALARTNAPLRKYSGNVLSRGAEEFAQHLADPPRGLAEIADIPRLRARSVDLLQDRGEKRCLSLTTVLTAWLAAQQNDDQAVCPHSAKAGGAGATSLTERR